MKTSATDTQWTGYPAPENPDNVWIDEKTGEYVSALSGKRCGNYTELLKQEPSLRETGTANAIGKN